MKKSNIDKDFIDIIDYLINMGFKPFSSCDGVLANHADPKSVTAAYISFLKSKKIIELMAAFLKSENSKNFEINIQNNSFSYPYEYLGNIISGNRYTVYFDNKNGNATSDFEKIIKSVAENKISILDNEIQILSNIDKAISDDGNSNLNFSISLNSKYQPYIKRTNSINKLLITTKENLNSNNYKDMNFLCNILSKKFGIVQKSDNLNETFENSEFSIGRMDGCEIYFENNIGQILEIINYARQIERSLPEYEYVEPDYDDLYFEDDFEL